MEKILSRESNVVNVDYLDDYVSMPYFASDYTDRWIGLPDFSIDYLDHIWGWAGLKSEESPCEQVCNNAIDFCYLLVREGKKLPDNMYYMPNGTIMLEWEDVNEKTVGAIEVGKTRWVSYFRYGQDSIENFNTDWLPDDY